jgi:hypothetical protein
MAMLNYSGVHIRMLLTFVGLLHTTRWRCEYPHSQLFVLNAYYYHVLENLSIKPSFDNTPI